jgi:hypothetical protein
LLDMSTLGDTTYVHPVIKILPHVAISGGR